jgi:hypothetical protein
MNNSNENNNSSMPLSYKIDGILRSFTKGQGSNPELGDKLNFIDDLTLDYLNGTYQLKFQSQEHLLAYFVMMFNRDIKDRSIENIDKLFEHLNSGAYLSLNHTDGSNSAIPTDKYKEYKTLFESLGIDEVKSNGKGSKLTQLLCEPTESTVTILSVNGFSNISPLIDGFKVIGLKVELPKSAD